MKLTEINVEGFGVWNDLRLRQLSPEITVLYGPNEAGKTTLMHFLRAMLYGVTPERRERYLPPRNGGQPGGQLGVISDDGPFEVARYAERGTTDRGRVRITLPDGEEQGDRLLREALESVDERTYTNVFAIGLDEINELGALEGAEAARWIYRLTSGLDRVSLYDVIQGLRSSRRQLLGPAGEPSLLYELYARRETIQAEIGELTISSRQWAKLAVEMDEVETHFQQLSIELKQAERHARRIELAVGLKPLWSERLRVEEQRALLDSLRPLPDGALALLDSLNQQAEEHQRKGDVLRGQRRQVIAEIRELGINESLRRSCCRLDALSEQQEWLESLERQSAELSEEVERLDTRADSERARLAKLWRHKPTPEAAPVLNEDTLDHLQPAAAAVREAEQLVVEAKREVDSRRGAEQKYASQMESAITSSDKLGLPPDIESAGELVTTLRKRLKAEQKLEQTRRQAMDLEQSNRDLIEQQVMPIEWFIPLAMAFALCAIMTFLPFFTGVERSATWLFWPGGGLALLFARFLFEDNRADQLDAVRQQVDLAERQISEAQRDREALAGDQPMAEGSVVLRLQNAERHLAELERMLPVEAERRRAKVQASSAEETLALAKEELVAAEKEWRSALRAVGLPDETTAAELEKLANQYRGLAELEQRSQGKQEELERIEREYAKVVKRIEALAEQADLVVEDAEPLDQLSHLLSEQRLQQNRVEHRKKLQERSRDLKEKQQAVAAAAQRVEDERQSLFRSASVTDEEAYRRLAAQHDEARRFEEQRARISREIVAAIGKAGAEEDFVELLEGPAAGRLDTLWNEANAKHEELEQSLRDLVARRGLLQAQRQAMIDDTSLADRRVELGLIESQIDLARERWRERAAVGAMLELIRNDYEEHRQPETLIEASKYLERLTRGRYPRVWTPLADDVLLVDDADGVSLPVEALSRGAREQLFLSVRLALVAMYARRGVQLPMILDDVLVNFDDRRARIAAEVLTRFAADGHQLLVFTCHEHVWEMFKSLQADVRRLPVHYADQLTDEVQPIEPALIEPPEEDEEELVVEDFVAPEPAPRPKKRKKRRPEPVVVVEPAPPVAEPLPAVEAEYGELAAEAVEASYSVIEPLPVLAPAPAPLREPATVSPELEWEYAASVDAPYEAEAAELSTDETLYAAEPTERLGWRDDDSPPQRNGYRIEPENAADSWLEEAEAAWASVVD
ncbi:AAA family ATPase [Botrimarina hoheduenensis]|uniref:YhaN AAA domain-containing protein n=1 Tax=Botrimarina hoheduenensis TaxID=2528000 RepID=A0A5C5VYX1_9BACT|nr:AAA family ATPase [Botrimarina hoheduenensis]TWT42712.1 hypothetical protein Pla111_26850 [Botrimarina hoheduenensis]